MPEQYLHDLKISFAGRFIQGGVIDNALRIDISPVFKKELDDLWMSTERWPEQKRPVFRISVINIGFVLQ